jgi:hypothetical protein
MIQAHADAILDALRADADLIVYPVANGQPGSGTGVVPPGAEPPYVAVHITYSPALGPDPVAPTLDGRSTRGVARAFCHCVGHDDIAARAVAQRVAAALLDVKLTIAGRTCFPARYDSGTPPTPDESTGTAVISITDVYRLESVPGPTP